MNTSTSPGIRSLYGIQIAFLAFVESNGKQSQEEGKPAAQFEVKFIRRINYYAYNSSLATITVLITYYQLELILTCIQ